MADTMNPVLQVKKKKNTRLKSINQNNIKSDIKLQFFMLIQGSLNQTVLPLSNKSQLKKQKN